MGGSKSKLLLGIGCGALLVCGLAVAAPRPGAGWLCRGADGTVVSAHPAAAEAMASCQERAQSAAGGIFFVVPASAADEPVSVSEPVVMKASKCEAPGPCPANLPLSGRRGSWSWVPPTRLENGNIATDLAYFAMYRQPFAGEPEPVAEISPKVTNVFWGMDTRDADACFWIEAVRVNSAPMPSDRSNRICIDAKGQLLPQA